MMIQCQQFSRCTSCSFRLQHRKGSSRVRSVSEEERNDQLGMSKQELQDMALKIIREDPEKSAQLDRLAAAEQRVADLVAQQKSIQDEYEQTLRKVANEEMDKVGIISKRGCCRSLNLSRLKIDTCCSA
eukprot:TRINITY_DN11816_c3_g2_i2.p3 TRINITY_DN11816_c3_g2~~TRINITY_DN11816_c3_g2_i2.p3  ORF type:complete len:129 (+),score=6.70 TRINITY_DN11816_c3_g2_i2:23-409(+)